MEWLPLDDLGVFSRTCKRLQALCKSQFLRKYPKEANQAVHVEIKFDGKLKIDPDYGVYVKYFYNFIKTLNLSVELFQEDRQRCREVNLSSLVTFMKSKCDENFYKIEIFREFELYPFCIEIEEVLRSVKSVRFSFRKERGEDEAAFLKYCPKVETIMLFCHGHVENVDAILEQKYNHLKHFYFIYGDPMILNSKKLKTFFLNNDTIRSLAFSFDFEVKKNLAMDREDSTVKFIETLAYAMHLERLYLSIDGKLRKCFEKNCRNFNEHLNVLRDRDNFKTLELRFVECADLINSYGQRFGNWKQLTKVHLRSMRLTDSILLLRSFVYLRVIVIHWVIFESDKRIVTQSLALPKVEEVQLDCTGSFSSIRDVSSYIMQFVRHWTSLKRILIIACRNKLDIAALRRARESLSNACELTIYTDYENNPTDLDHTLVKLKLIEINYKCDVSPFQRFCMPSNQSAFGCTRCVRKL